MPNLVSLKRKGCQKYEMVTETHDRPKLSSSAIHPSFSIISVNVNIPSSMHCEIRIKYSITQDPQCFVYTITALESCDSCDSKYLSYVILTH